MTHESPKTDHKTAALCKLVARTLNTVFAGDCDDEVLQDLLVHSVLPAPNAGNLLVLVYPRSLPVEPADVLTRLDRFAGHLRAAVAEATVRKRTPQLTFQVLRTPGSPPV